MNITVIAGTSRPDSNSMRVAQACSHALASAGGEARILNLREVRAQWLEDSSYGKNVPELEAIVQGFIRPVKHILFVVPEYNGGFPGIMKYFIDACDHGEWANKRIALVGITTGRSGNLRGVDHLTAIFHYLKSEVLSRKVYISQVNHALDEDGRLVDGLALKELAAQAEAFVRF